MIMARLITRIVSNTVALYAADWLVAGFAVRGTWHEYVLAGAVLGLLNLFVKPILKVISLPLIVLTLGLFTLVINAILLWAVAALFPGIIAITSIMALAWATLVLTAVNLLISHTS